MTVLLKVQGESVVTLKAGVILARLLSTQAEGGETLSSVGCALCNNALRRTCGHPYDPLSLN